MKMFFGALALALAVPAAAQTAPAAAPDAHAQHKGMDLSNHGQAKHDCKDCCYKMKQCGGNMECMD
jgi:Spy/CpxP family protein refolding chaperone